MYNVGGVVSVGVADAVSGMVMVGGSDDDDDDGDDEEWCRIVCLPLVVMGDMIAGDGCRFRFTTTFVAICVVGMVVVVSLLSFEEGSVMMIGKQSGAMNLTT